MRGADAEVMTDYRSSASSSDRPRIGIIGAGLVGGSLAIAAARRGYPVLVWDTDDSIREDAVVHHALGWAHGPEVLVSMADVVVIATPVDAIPEVVTSIAPLLRPGQVLMDVASTKVSPSVALETAPSGVRVVGSHPMAGRTPGGWAHASADLFVGCVWVLCPPDGETVPHEVMRLIVEVGAHQTIVCSAEEHDRAVASISHGVQVSATSLAAAVNQVVADERLPWILAAGGWRDSTRIAASDPSMWVPILLENRDNVLPVVDETIARLVRMRDALASEDGSRVAELIEDGAAARRVWEDTRAEGI